MTRIDIGCDDFEAAARNREMVKEKRNIIAYLEVESAIAHTPRGQPLATWIPRGELTFVGRRDWQQFGGDNTNLVEVEMPTTNPSVLELPLLVEEEEVDEPDLTDPTGEVV